MMYGIRKEASKPHGPALAILNAVNNAQIS
jgi:hypothetical protein